MILLLVFIGSGFMSSRLIFIQKWIDYSIIQCQVLDGFLTPLSVFFRFVLGKHYYRRMNVERFGKLFANMPHYYK